MRKQFFLPVLILFTLFPALHKAQDKAVFYSKEASLWADSVVSQLSLDEKLGQLFMVAAYSNKDSAHIKQLEKLVVKENIGGMIFFQGGPVRQARMLNHFQSKSKVPLLIGMDAEWDLAMRLDSTFKFPFQMTMGASDDSLLIYQTGRLMGRHAKRLGVHITFSPVVDLNTNPKNPIINARSFGENPERVSKLASAMMVGIQDEGVLACAKHFPGHGDTDSDSHKTLPSVNHSLETFRNVEWVPYKSLINAGLGSVMVAHLNVPSLDESGTPSSLSKEVVGGYLSNELSFDGLIFTDALNMKGVSSQFAPGEVDLKALLAGNDIMLFAQDVKKAKELMSEAVETGTLSFEVLDAHVRKILLAKYWAGLTETPQISVDHLVEDLNDNQSVVVRKRVFEKAITVLKNEGDKIPFRTIQGKRIGFVSMGEGSSASFFNGLNLYAKVEDLGPLNSAFDFSQLSAFDEIILGYSVPSKTPWSRYQLNKSQRKLLEDLGKEKSFHFVAMCNPYALRDLEELEYAQSLILGYQSDDEVQQILSQVIFGASTARGKLPVTLDKDFKVGDGTQTLNIGRLQYGYPEEVGIQSVNLEPIHHLLDSVVATGASPGGQILVAKNGVVILHEAFGTVSSDSEVMVTKNHLYDLASITKIMATIPLVMDLYEKGKIDLDSPLSDYLPELDSTNKRGITLRTILAHQAGLEAWIPFYLRTLNEDGGYKDGFFSNQPMASHPTQVAKNLYTTEEFKDTIYKAIYDSELGDTTYKYSDLGYYLLLKLIEKEYQQPIDKLLSDRYYQSIGSQTLGFLPLDRFPEEQIVPTEEDLLFRKQLVHGYVHDQGAALMGGVAGHAGLFSNANDLAKMMQMYLDGGVYGGVRYFQDSTLNEFTRCQFCETENRRGAGFDKPQFEGEGPTCGCVSLVSFGHTGFTGTIAWADPEEELLYIFLSNRINPSAENKKLIKMGYRTRIQSVIYDAIHAGQ